MATDIEELRFVADLAHNGGVMQAKIEHLENENARLRSDNEQLRDELARVRAEFEEMKATKQQNSPTYVVNNFFLLSMPKTYKYVSALDNNERRFVGHFIHQTLEDGTPQSVFAQVDEMTQLEGKPEERLADAMEELAKKPSTQNFYGDTVSEKTVIPSVGNYKPQIATQNIEAPMPSLGQQQEPKQLEDE